jgi:hypothetical protein
MKELHQVCRVVHDEMGALVLVVNVFEVVVSILVHAIYVLCTSCTSATIVLWPNVGVQEKS